MKCFELQGPDGVGGLKLVDRPIPKPGPGEVLVRITAATLNCRDLLTVKGGYGSRQKFPLIPVSDGAGVVEAVGSGVREIAPSDRVVGGFFETWIGGEPSAAKMHGALGGAVDGVLAEYRVFPSQALVRTPDHLTDAEALAMSAIPLHMQRKFERRWAARFASPVASAVPKTTDSKRDRQQLAAPRESKPAEQSRPKHG
jgi:NADPH:quinone reductase-like Zn-dependent oxidoreductase